MSGSGKRKPSFIESAPDPEATEEDDSFEASDLVGSLATQPGDILGKVSTSSFSDDLDYESVSSPGNSSTASGPTYVRPAGFEHHAQDVLAPLAPSQSSKAFTSR